MRGLLLRFPSGGSLVPFSGGVADGSVDWFWGEVWGNHIEVVGRIGLGNRANLTEVPDIHNTDVGIVLLRQLDPLDGVGGLLLACHAAPDQLVGWHLLRRGVPAVFVEPDRTIRIAILFGHGVEERETEEVQPIHPGRVGRRIGEAIGVRGEDVKRAFGPGVVHLLQVVRLDEGSRRALEGLGEGSTEDDHAGICLLRALVAQLEELGVLAGIGRLPSPLDGEVRLIPDLHGRHLPLVVAHKRVDELGIFVVAIRRGIEVGFLLGPRRRVIQTGDHLDAILLGETDDVVVLCPGELSTLVLDLIPEELLLHPADVGRFHHLERAFPFGDLHLLPEEGVGTEGVLIGIRRLVRTGSGSPPGGTPRES